MQCTALHAYYRPLLGLCCSTFHDCWLHVCSGLAASSSAADVTHDIRGVQIPHFTRPMYVIIQYHYQMVSNAVIHNTTVTV